MKERPILFSAPMVRAILEGRKTQTRRVMRDQPHEAATVTVEHFNQTVIDRHGDEQPGPEIFGAWWADGECGIRCPYGQPGDRLWVRESGWERPERTHKMMREGADTWPRFAYAADSWSEQDRDDFKAWGFKSRPSIHMPRWASRILLEITGVRIERLQDISDQDALAEGVSPDMGLRWQSGDDTPRGMYGELWESINGPGSWAADPWVWVVEFRRIEA